MEGQGISSGECRAPGRGRMDWVRGNSRGPFNRYLHQTLQHCQTADVLMKCKNSQHGGHTYFNQGTEWNPANEMSAWDTSNHEDCHPCCKDPDTSIQKCPDTDRPDEEGVSYDQLRDLAPAPGRDIWDRGMMGNSRGLLMRDLHCPRAQTSQKCRAGSGKRIYSR